MVSSIWEEGSGAAKATSQSDLLVQSRGESRERETREEDPSLEVYDNDTDYNDEQYPPAEDRYKQLEDRLSTMEIQRIPGMDFEEMGLVSGVVIP